MRKSSELIGFSVISSNNGDKICSIRNIIYSKKKFRILGFLISENGFFKEAKIIKFKNISTIGKDVVIVKNESIIENASSIPEVDRLITEGNKIIGVEVLSDDGESLGYIKDIVFDDDTGKILGFILTDGLIQDLMDGRNILPYIKGIKFGSDALIICKKIKDDFEKNKDNFKKLLGI